MINDRYLIVYDYETTGINPHTCGITQIAAVVLHPRTLNVLDKFQRDNIKWRPNDTVEDKAFAITRKDKAYIEKSGVDPKQAWGDYVNFVQQYNKSKSSFNAPIPCGYNIINYDNILTARYCKDYGPWDAKKNQQSLISSYMSYDLLHKMFWLTESTSEEVMPDIKLPTISQLMGLDIEGAHDALVDTENCAKIITKFIRLDRYMFPKIKLKDAFKQS